VIALVDGALRNKQGQPWMYEALGIAMQAGGATHSEIERALMSAVDFSTQTSDLMNIAQYMIRAMAGNPAIERRALKLFRQVSELEPTSPEAYLQGIYLAQKLNDVDGLRWTTVGILSQAWPQSQQKIPQFARNVALATIEQLRAAKRTAEATDFKTALDQALVRDCVVVVSWTGDADMDLLVEEPTGSVCSFRNPRTTGGGLMMGDTSSAADRDSKTLSESYVCAQGFDGTYKMQLRRVWGKPTVDRVTVDFYTHRGTKMENHLRKQINLADGEAALAFALDNGRRKEPLEQQQVANAVNGQLAVGRAILAQQAAAANPQQVNQQLNQVSSAGTQAGYTSGTGNGLGGFGGLGISPFMFPGRVGYQPVIITLPEGTNMSATAVVSADRRYVRCTTQPLFSSIPKVNTFNFANGSSGTSGGGTGS
jgi:hypothetical protein